VYFGTLARQYWVCLVKQCIWPARISFSRRNISQMHFTLTHMGSADVLRHGSYECNGECGIATAEQWQSTANVTVPNLNLLYNTHGILWQRDWFLLTSKCITRGTVFWQGWWRTRLCSGAFNTTNSYFTGWLVQMLNSPQLETVTAFVYLYNKITSLYKDYLKCWKVPHCWLWMGSFPYSMTYLVIVRNDIFWLVCHYVAWLVSFRYSMKQPATVLCDTLP
jgi:hypothetical protein